MTENEKWTKANPKWSQEITEWVRSICPAREHGFSSRAQIVEEINRRFKRDFSVHAFCTHCYDKKIDLGLCYSENSVRGGVHWRHRPVGSFQRKKGYVRIKVAEPNVWMQYQRYVWEQNHPGESGEGKRFIFLDGDRTNFSPDNIECVTPAEQSVMSEYGAKADTPPEEKRIILLRARITIERNRMLGGSKAATKVKSRLQYLRNREDPEWKARQAERAHQRHLEIMADPVRHQKQIDNARAYREKNRERVNAWANERRKRLKETDPVAYEQMLERNRASARKRKERLLNGTK